MAQSLQYRARLSAKLGVGTLALTLLFVLPPSARAASCTTQGELQPQDRNTLTSIGGRLAAAVFNQDYSALQAALLPAEAADWPGIHDSIELGAPAVKGGQVQLRNIYLLDAGNLAAPADTQFFCSNTTGSLTVTMNMRALPAGRYAVILADATGAPLAGQIGIVLAWDPTGATPAWKLAGLSVRQGSFASHDGVWYWSRARELVRENQPQTNSWPAWFSYEAARYLLLPVDFISSPNSESSPRSRPRSRTHLRKLSPTPSSRATAPGKSTLSNWMPASASRIWPSSMSQPASPTPPPSAPKLEPC